MNKSSVSGLEENDSLLLLDPKGGFLEVPFGEDTGAFVFSGPALIPLNNVELPSSVLGDDKRLFGDYLSEPPPL